MKFTTITGKFTLLFLPILLSCCQNSNVREAKPIDKGGSADSIAINFNEGDEDMLTHMQAKAEAYRDSITDETFLQIAGGMSDPAISPITSDGWNKDFAINQVIYIAALDRAKRGLIYLGDRLELPAQSGSELNISEDIYLFIKNPIEEWNEGIQTGALKVFPYEPTGYYVEVAAKN